MQTQSSNYFSGLVDDLTGLALDYGRSKLIDVQSTSDEGNLPDKADLWFGYGSSSKAQRGGAPGIPWGTLALVAAVAVVGIIVVKRVL